MVLSRQQLKMGLHGSASLPVLGALVFNRLWVTLRKQASSLFGGMSLLPKWCARQESNLDMRLRRPPFYPLNYGRVVCFRGPMLRMRTGGRQVVFGAMCHRFLFYSISCLLVPSLALA